MKAATMKKKKPQDATLRNVRAAVKRNAAVTNKLKELERRIKALEKRMLA